MALESFVDTQAQTGRGSPQGLTLMPQARATAKRVDSTIWGTRAWWRGVIGALGSSPALQKLAVDGEIEAWNLPQGVIAHLFRDIAAGKTRHAHACGLDTFVDPRHGGGKVNTRTTQDLVQLMHIEGKEYLFYKALPIQVGIIRATTADADGNLTMEREALTLEALAITMAARNSGGIVIAQVERVAERGSPIRAKLRCQGAGGCSGSGQRSGLPHADVCAELQPGLCGRDSCACGQLAPMPMSERKLIARRAAQELTANAVVNLGIGMPEGWPVWRQGEDHRFADFDCRAGCDWGHPRQRVEFWRGH